MPCSALIFCLYFELKFSLYFTEIWMQGKCLKANYKSSKFSFWLFFFQSKILHPLWNLNVKSQGKEDYYQTIPDSYIKYLTISWLSDFLPPYKECITPFPTYNQAYPSSFDKYKKNYYALCAQRSFFSSVSYISYFHCPIGRLFYIWKLPWLGMEHVTHFPLKLVEIFFQLTTFYSVAGN